MRKLTSTDIVDHRDYEREREAFRAEVIALKKRRRIALGDIMTLVFENTTTMRFQVQEMARAERMLRDEQIEQELETYNALIPDEGELSATLFLELTTDEQLRHWLPLLVGIQNHVVFVVGDTTVRAFEEDPERLTREDSLTTTVHYLKFEFDEATRRAFAAEPVRLIVDHPEYQVDLALTDEQRAELAGDLAA